MTLTVEKMDGRSHINRARCECLPVTKNLVWGKNGPGGPFLVDKIWSGETKFGYQKSVQPNQKWSGVENSQNL